MSCSSERNNTNNKVKIDELKGNRCSSKMVPQEVHDGTPLEFSIIGRMNPSLACEKPIVILKQTKYDY